MIALKPTISLLNDLYHIVPIHFLQKRYQHVHREWGVAAGDDPVCQQG